MHRIVVLAVVVAALLPAAGKVLAGEAPVLQLRPTPCIGDENGSVIYKKSSYLVLC
jgi:hypothetical protein